MGVSTLYLMIALAIHGASGQAPDKPTLRITSATNPFDDGASDVTLTCVTATTGVTYSMTRDETTLTAGDGFTAASGILIIGTFDTATDTGLYKCKATKGGDTSEESEPLKVAVQNAPADPTLVFETPEKFVIGDDVKLTCTSAASATFEWYHGANKVTPPQTGATLTLTSYATGNNGNYKCRGLTATPAKYSIYSKVLTLAPVECTDQSHCSTKTLNTKCDTATNNCVDPCASKACKAATKCTAQPAGTCKCTDANTQQFTPDGKCVACTEKSHCNTSPNYACSDQNTCVDPCGSNACKTEPETKDQCKANADGTCKCEAKGFKVDNGKCVKSGSTNLQMSYLMLGLVTLVSAVWTGRV